VVELEVTSTNVSNRVIEDVEFYSHWKFQEIMTSSCSYSKSTFSLFSPTEKIVTLTSMRTRKGQKIISTELNKNSLTQRIRSSYVACVQKKMSPLNTFVLASEKLCWIEHSTQTCTTQICVIVPKFCTIPPYHSTDFQFLRHHVTNPFSHIIY